MKARVPLTVVVRHANGRRERIRFESTSARIGSAAHCEVRLPMDQAAGEHVVLVRQGDAVIAEARCSQPAASIDGAPFTSAPLASSAVLALVDTRISVSCGEPASNVDSVRTFRSRAAWGIAAVAVAGAAIGIGRAKMEADGVDSVAPPTPPALWNAAEATCRSESVDEAGQRAEQLAALAHAKHLRGAFAFADAVAAVPVYEEAADCFRRAGHLERARHAESRGAALRRSNTESYRARQLRLELALEQRDWTMVDREVRALTAMLGPREGAYSRWLAALHRRVGSYADQEE